MIRTASLVIAVAALAARTAHALPVGGDHACTGVWVGESHNNGSTEMWTIEVNLTAAAAGARCGTVEYPSLGCGGTLEDCEALGDRDIRTREVYSHGQQFCAPAGTLTLHCEGERMQYIWDGLEHNEAWLHRPPGYQPPGMKPTVRAADARPAAPGPGPDAEPPRKKGCSCSGGDGAGPSALVIAATVAALARRRRRHSQRQTVSDTAIEMSHT